jgi:hypothetical protein
MMNFPKFEVAISDADRAEIEAIYIELMRVRDAAALNSSDATALHRMDPRQESGAQ